MLALSVRVLAWCFEGVEIGVEILRGGGGDFCVGGVLQKLGLGVIKFCCENVRIT